MGSIIVAGGDIADNDEPRDGSWTEVAGFAVCSWWCDSPTTVAVGGEVFPHTHPTHEFYFVMTGVGTMIIGDEQRNVAPGDLVYIPPDQVHSLRTIGDEPIHCFCFAVGVKGAGNIDYTNH